MKLIGSVLRCSSRKVNASGGTETYVTNLLLDPENASARRRRLLRNALSALQPRAVDFRLDSPANPPLAVALFPSFPGLPPGA